MDANGTFVSRASPKSTNGSSGRPSTGPVHLFASLIQVVAQHKQFRGFAARYDKLSTRHQAGIRLISTIIWLRTL